MAPPSDRYKRLILLATWCSWRRRWPTSSAKCGPARVPAGILLPLAAFYFAEPSTTLDRRRCSPDLPVGRVALLVWAEVRAVLVGPSEAWHRFAAWLIA